jgi:hypothetical protein
MDDLARLVAIEEIKQLKARCFRLLDTRDYDGFEDTFTDDAVMDVRFPDRLLTDESGLYVGASVIREFAERAIGEGVSVDHSILPEISITSPTTATGIWAMEDRVRWPDGYPNRRVHGLGHEHDTYERTSGGWKIKTTKLVRLVVDIERSGTSTSQRAV